MALGFKRGGFRFISAFAVSQREGQTVESDAQAKNLRPAVYDEPRRPILSKLRSSDNFEENFPNWSRAVQVWSKTTLKSLLIPGGILLSGVVVLMASGWLTLALPALSFLYYCALIGGMLLAWRFHSSRSFFALVVLFLAQEAVALSGGAFAWAGTPEWTAVRAAALLVPLNFVLIALMQERGFTVAAIAPVGLFLSVQSVIVAVLCVGAGMQTSLARPHHLSTAIALPGYAPPIFAGAGIFLLVRFLLTRKPVDGALLWSLSAYFLSLRLVGTPRFSMVYSATAACILAASIIENSYLLAYHDELTTLPSRRAFNDAMLRLQNPYSIAVVDIDHFKRFNDTYGHDTGDQVLRLVATALSRVTGGGQAYRCGGEEFNILFPGKTTAEVVEHLQHLRLAIESSEFRIRSGERRQVTRGPDRRNARLHGRARKGQAIRELSREKSPAPVSVTVSIGVATSVKDAMDPDLVLQAADKALYRAKANGRNRLETAPIAGRRSRVKAAGIA
jgi:diguanylate cyclase (GGDEF)-like protein